MEGRASVESRVVPLCLHAEGSDLVGKKIGDTQERGL